MCSCVCVYVARACTCMYVCTYVLMCFCVCMYYVCIHTYLKYEYVRM